MSKTKLPEQRLEDRLRREAKKLGLKVVKSRVRNPTHLAFGSYWIVDAETHGVVAGDSEVGLTLLQVEEEIQERRMMAQIHTILDKAKQEKNAKLVLTSDGRAVPLCEATVEDLEMTIGHRLRSARWTDGKATGKWDRRPIAAEMKR